MKVLILECPITTGGTGHEVAARSIQEALKKADKRINAVCTCPIKSNSKTAKYVSAVYLKIIKHAPHVMGYFHESRTISRLTNKIRSKTDKAGYRSYKALIYSFKPDVIVCTHAYPCWAVSLIKEREHLDVPLVGVVTDYYSHYYWPVRFIDKYIVATKEAKKEVVLRGVNSSLVEVLGIPISLKFLQKKNKKELMKKLGLKQQPTILVMGGGLGIGYLGKVVRLLDSLDNIQIIAVCGKNEKLKKKLLKRGFNNKVLVMGHVSNMDELMAVSDLAVTKAGGLTVSECLARNLPMVLLRSLPGQEERNADYLAKNKVAVKIKKEKYLLESVQTLLHKNLDVRKYAKPSAALDIAKLIQTLIKERGK